MKRFDVLDRKTEIFGRHLLEASAGTGKTFTIEHLVCRFLIDEKFPIPLEKILVVTFTKAATREMKQRIYSNLQNAHAMLSGKKEITLPYLNLEDPKVALERIEAAIHCFDRASIYTIHGFCYRMLRQFALTASVGVSLRDPDEMHGEEIIKEELFDFFKQGCSHHSKRQLEKIWKKEKGDIEKIARGFLHLVEKSTPLNGGLSFAGSFKQFLQKIDEIGSSWPIEIEKFMEDYALLILSFKRMQNEEYESQAKKIGILLEKKFCTESEFEDLLETDFFLKGFSVENQKVRANLPPKEKLHYPDLIFHLRKEIYPILKNANDPTKTLLRVAEDFRKAWMKKKEELELLFPDDILIKMEEGSKNPAFISKVRGLYDAIIVDEFQDTDEKQWNIFETIFLEGQTKAVYFVGDPKQSIYMFRKADLYTFLRASEKVGLENKKFLDTNYRSDPPLVGALNTLFAYDQVGHWISLPKEEGHLEYVEVQSGKKDSNFSFQDDRKSIHFAIASSEMGREKKWPTHNLEQNAFFPFVAKEIIHLEKQGISLSEIAILVKDRYQAQRLKDFLSIKKIPSNIRRTKDLSETIAFDAMEDLIRAIDNHESSHYMRKVLAGPFFEFSAKQMKEFEENTLPITKRLFRELYSLFQEKGLSSCFEYFFSFRMKDKSVLEYIMESPDLSLYSGVQQTIEILLQQYHQNGSNLFLLSQYLQEKRNSTGDGALKQRQEEDQNAVVIMTIHMSKGLEFDIVFALGLMYRSTKQEEIVLIKDSKYDFIDSVDLENTQTISALNELDAEKMRHLYVAMTRSKKRLYIPVALEERGKPPVFSTASPIELFLSRLGQKDLKQNPYLLLEGLNLSGLQTHLGLLAGKASISYSVLGLESSSPRDVQSEKPSLISPQLLSLDFKKHPVLSYTSFASKSKSPNKELNREETTNLPGGIKTGVLFHTLLEKIFVKDLFAPFQKDKVRELAKEILFGSPQGEHLDEILESLEKIFVKELPLKEPFSLQDLESQKYQVEMQFLFPYKECLLKGSIDLVFEKDGKYYFVDWKSNLISSDVTLEQVMKKGDYFLQASIYAEAVKRYIAIFDKRPFSECFGGAFYVFLRTGESYHFYPEELEL